ncbi:MAG: hypothetical protein COS71_02995 [Candidatus Moranbacteria bacterium CG06_land_8_20_14_3_00_40_12]|nr:MAG: hypothetical protein COS71_02995 [Candidatus Moranbacteria bacterium CG06_land_8_20_14_3_00_40_12]
MKSKEAEARKEIEFYRINQNLIQKRKENNLEVLALMKKHPKKLNPDFEYETTPDFAEWCKKKWENDIQIDNLRLNQQIKQSDQQIDAIRNSLKKNENKEVKKGGETR